jgi:hypothetical protein
MSGWRDQATLKLILWISIVSILWPTLFAPICLAEDETSILASTSDEIIQVAIANIPPEPSALEGTIEPIADPLEPINRAFFHFNDKLYFWVLKPVATGYKAVVPEDARVGVRNFFSNLTTPVRGPTACYRLTSNVGGRRRYASFEYGLEWGVSDPGKDAHLEKQDRFRVRPWESGGLDRHLLDWPILGPPM